MKFGKYLAARMLDLPEYSSYFIDYKALKKLIKSLSKPNGSNPQEVELALQENKATFFFRLERELEKVNNFYLEKEASMKVRLEILVKKEQEALQTGRLTTRNSVAYISLYEGFQRFRRDLDKFEQFIELNETGFSKVLKKWDKRSKSQTKELYLSTAVEVQPVFHRDEISELSDVTAAAILHLETLVEGGSSVFEPASTSSSKSTSKSDIRSPAGSIANQSTNQPNSSHSNVPLPALLNFPEDGTPQTQNSLFSAFSDDRATDDLYYEFVSTASAPLSPETDWQNWINKLRTMPDAQKRMSKIFLLSISSGASDSALLALYSSGYVDLHTVDELSGQNCLHACAAAVQPIASNNASSESDIPGEKYPRQEIIKLALAAGVDVAKPDSSGRTPLHYACMNNKRNLINVFLNAGAPVNCFDKDNFSPMLYAIQFNYADCVQELVNHGASITPKAETDYIPLTVACYFGAYESARILLKKGLEMDSLPALPDAEGLYPIHVVARSGHSKLVRLLKEFHHDINKMDKLNYWSPLFYAASEGHVDTVRELLNCGADPTIVDENGKRASYYASWEGHLDCLELLSEAGAKTDDQREPASEFSAGEAITSDSSGDLLQAKNVVVKEPSALDSQLKQVSLGPSSPTQFVEPEEPDMEMIPALELPPPIIPLRRYGHSFLEKKIFVQLVFAPGLGSVDFFGSVPGSGPGGSLAGLPTAHEFTGRTTISSRVSDIIPRNIVYPLNDADRVVSFQVDDLSDFTIDFEFFPIFGTRMIAKATALSHFFNSTTAGESRNAMFGCSSTCTLPLFDMRLRTIGQLKFAVQIVRPYAGIPLEISKFDTYWKSTTSQIEAGAVAAPPSVSVVSSTIAGLVGGSGATATGPRSIMDMGLDDNSLVKSTMGATQAAVQTLSFVTSSSLSGEYLCVRVYWLKDSSIVVSPSKDITIGGVSVPLAVLTEDQLLTITAQFYDIAEVHESLRKVTTMSDLKQILARVYIPLSELLEYLPLHFNLNLDIYFPNQTEEEEKGADVWSCITDLNQYVDDILAKVFDHVRQSRAASDSSSHHSGGPRSRSVLFSSNNADVCTVLNWKQPNYPVFFAMDQKKAFKSSSKLTSYGSELLTPRSLRGATQYAVKNNLLGIICDDDVLRMVPDLVDTIRSFGLILISANPSGSSLGTRSGVNGVLSQGVLVFPQAIDM